MTEPVTVAGAEGPRTPTMSRGRILQYLDELLRATEWLVEGRLGYTEAPQGYFERLLRLNGGDESTIFSIDDIHSEFVWQKITHLRDAPL